MCSYIMAWYCVSIKLELKTISVGKKHAMITYNNIADTISSDSKQDMNYFFLLLAWLYMQGFI